MMTLQQRTRDYPWQLWRRRVIWGSLTVLVAMSVVLAGIAWRGRAALDKEIQAIRAKGFPASSADIEKSCPNPPKEQNAAEIYKQSFDVQEKLASGPQCEDMMKQVNDSPKRSPLAEALHRGMTEYLEANAEALRLLHEAAKRPASRYPLDFSRGVGMPMAHLAKIRQGVRLLQIEALVAAEDGDTRRALSAITAALAAGNSVRQEPVFNSQLTRIACNGITLSTINRMMNMAAFSDGELAQLGGTLRAEEDPGALTRTLAGERALCLSAFDRPELLLNEIPEVQRLGPGVASAAGSLIRITGIANNDRRRFLSIMDEMVTASQRPIYEAIPLLRAMDPLLHADRGWFPNFTNTLVLDLDHSGEVFAHGAANIATAETAVAIERYRLVNGNCAPENLEELVPAFLPAVPVDPFDGKPLRYRYDDSGYSVYSISRNMQDNGGTPDTYDQGWRAPDLVFHVDHAPPSAN